MKSEEDAPL
jgi:hypothetical protein